MEIIEEFSISLPITIEFGRGVSKKAGQIAKNMKLKKALIVTDKGIVRAGLLRGITDALNTAGIKFTTFDEVIPNPTDVVVEKAASTLKDEKCDHVIAIGGGSSMDTGKGVALLATNPGSIREYEVHDFEDLLKGMVKNHLLPLIAIPTTAGTGSEADFWAIVTDTDRKFKMCLGQFPLYPGGPYLGATAALIDPELTLTLPPHQTASTGFDALLHLIETYIAKGSISLISPLALFGIELIAKYLPIAYADGSNYDAREKVMLAATIGGICMNYANLTAIHALAEALGGMYGKIPHGVAIAIFTLQGMEYNRIAVPEKFAKIAYAMGEKIEHLSLRDAANKAVEAVKKLIEDLDLPTSLKEVNVKEEDIPSIAQRASKGIEIPGNPRIITYDDLLEITERVYGK